MSAENSEPGPSKDNNSFFKSNVGAMDTKLTDLLDRVYDEFKNGELRQIIRCEQLYDEENFEETLKLRIGKALSRHVKTRLRNSKFNVCEGYVNYPKSSQLCHRAGVERIVNNKLKFYCHEHDAERVRDYQEYKSESVELCGIHKMNKDELRQFAIEHGRRIRFRLKYNIMPDAGHEKYEGKLYTAYCLHWYVCPNCGNDQEVIKSLKKKKKIKFFQFKVKIQRDRARRGRDGKIRSPQ